MSRTETLTVDNTPMDVCVDLPSGAGPHPAMVVACHRGGLDAFTQKFVEDLAAAGYAAAAPDLFHRHPEDKTADNFLQNFDDDDIVDDLKAAAGLLKGLAAVNGDAIGVTGHCMGGRVAYLGAAANPDFKVCGVFYGGNIMKAWGQGHAPLIERSGNIECPVVGFFGNDDKNPSPDDVKRIHEELTKHRIDHEFHGYDGAGHAFQNFLNDNAYREEATKDSMAKLLAFLNKVIPPA